MNFLRHKNMKTSLLALFDSKSNDFSKNSIMKLVNQWKEGIDNDGTNINEEILIKQMFYAFVFWS